MTIWVDADACPAVIRDILFRAADRTATPLVLVANRLLRVPPSPHIRALQVEAGFDVADAYIAQQAQPGDIVVTADVPLAALVVEKGVPALGPRGELYTEASIQEALALRNFMTGLRDSGVVTGGPAALSARDRQAFAAQLDRLLLRKR